MYKTDTGLKFNRFLLALLFIIPLLYSCKKEKDKWTLTFYDEFSCDSLDRNIWKTRFDWGQTFSEDGLALCIDSAFSLKNGILYIKANNDTVTGCVYDENYNSIQKEYYYTSGWMNSAYSFSQLYGYFEIRCKTPLGGGFWPAFWLMSNNSWPPEIDVFEISGVQPNKMHMANHFNNKNKEHRQICANYYGPDFSDDFHIFAIEWNPKEIIWYLDNVQVYKTETCIPNERMFVIVNLDVVNTEFAGCPDNKTFFPGYLEVDYIRVYKENDR